MVGDMVVSPDGERGGIAAPKNKPKARIIPVSWTMRNTFRQLKATKVQAAAMLEHVQVRPGNRPTVAGSLGQRAAVNSG